MKTDAFFRITAGFCSMTTKKTGYLRGIGGAGTLPTATDDDLGGDRWRLGPGVFGGARRATGQHRNL